MSRSSKNTASVKLRFEYESAGKVTHGGASALFAKVILSGENDAD